ncbi:MAG: hypothetical protein ACK5M4_09585 [Pseudorhodobacter sp.]
MRTALALTILIFGSDLALAGSFSPPDGCTGWLTVQSRSCRVSNYYTCDQDPPGDQWRADFDQEGVYFLSRVDHEAQWVESISLPPPVRQTLDSGAADPASFSELLASGLDTFDFALSKETGEHSNVRGFDRLTGKRFVIDGVELQETQFDFTETDLDGNTLRRAQGNEYIHPEWRLFFAGPTQWDGGSGEWLPMDGSPLEFIFPGEPGFQSTQPLFECDAILSSYQPRGDTHVD